MKVKVENAADGDGYVVDLSFDLTGPDGATFEGRTAGELRWAGFEIKESIPDCAELKRQPDGSFSFEWFTITLPAGVTPEDFEDDDTSEEG